MSLLAVAKAFDIVPGWAWAGLLAAALVANCSAGNERDAAILEAAGAKVAAAGHKSALEQERRWHAEVLAEVTNDVRTAEGDLRDALEAQEMKDAEAQKTIAALRGNLARVSRAGGGSGLRDPHARACAGPGREPPGAAGTAAAGGAADAAQAGGLLSEPMERLLLDTIAEADTLNVAYASCRDDALSTRERLKELQLSPPRPASQVPAPS
jgi:hypothetical protein